VGKTKRTNCETKGCHGKAEAGEYQCNSCIFKKYYPYFHGAKLASSYLYDDGRALESEQVS
jgi:hypothetical protein